MPKRFVLYLSFLDEPARFLWDSQGWKLVITGHSLGAGVAALLALRLKNSFRGVNS